MSTVRFRNIADHPIRSSFGKHAIDVAPGEEFDLPLVFAELPAKRGMRVEEVGRSAPAVSDLESAAQPVTAFDRIMARIKDAKTSEELDELGPEFAKAKGSLSAAQQESITAAADERYSELDEPPESTPEPAPETKDEDPGPAVTPTEPAPADAAPAGASSEGPTGETSSAPADAASEPPAGEDAKPPKAPKASKSGKAG